MLCGNDDDDGNDDHDDDHVSGLREATDCLRFEGL